jgi:stage 0 DNA-binding protein|nr:MAG TPA: ParB protein [Caudoviricetes sp.]
MERKERLDMDKTFEFNPENIEKVAIDKISKNSWNPKLDNPPEMEDIKRSLKLNGYAQPILVRQSDSGYEIIDGAHRYMAAKELGYKELYVYNVGNVSDEEAKAFTIWMQTQVPFYELDLAPLAVELSDAGIELPFTEAQLIDFKNMSEFDFDSQYKDDEPVDEDNSNQMKTLTVKMTVDQLTVVKDAIKLVSENENVSEGRALELLVADGLAGYQQTNYIPENEKEE